MARSGSGPLLLRRNVKLDSFLKRNTGRALYERFRTCEPCVVVSDSVCKVYMHVVLSDECLYLTEYAPRTLTAAVSFARVLDIKLVSLTLSKTRRFLVWKFNKSFKYSQGFPMKVVLFPKLEEQVVYFSILLHRLIPPDKPACHGIIMGCEDKRSLNCSLILFEEIIYSNLLIKGQLI